ncbi:MAG: methyltransferase domain-containing protein [Lachnospiraceae bacterium]|nr:methyltransferase domain-containing protein [Lachnospiraceae bacterium]
MKLNKKVIIFGAGKNGEKLLQHLGESNVEFFCDNYKSGYVSGIKILRMSELKNMLQNLEYDIILSIDIDEVRKQLKDLGIPYWERVGNTNNYFNRKEIRESLDEELYTQYLKLDDYEGFLSREENWFRTSFISEKNEQLTRAMREENHRLVSQILSEAYDETAEEKVYEDEYFENRPGMRLIAKLIKHDSKDERKVCDLACGHGSFLREVKSERIKCYGVDVSSRRCEALSRMGIECRLGVLEHSGYQDESFDYVTMMECLEHVRNPFDAVKEAERILRRGGQLFITVPYGTNCDSSMHVRQFYENDLYSVIKKYGYTDIKIMQLPYLNDTYQDNLILSAKKQR